MEVATRMFERLVEGERSSPQLADEKIDVENVAVWEQTLRLGALCHDLGHLPFSHAAEKDLLSGGTHEGITRRLVQADPIAGYIESEFPEVRLDDVEYVAVGEKEMEGIAPRHLWIGLLSQIITANLCGADRMDYLLRDAHHAGVAYGRFDIARVIGTLRFLAPGAGEEGAPSSWIGIEEGGIHAAEALLLARYYMFQQVYFHKTRRALDLHLGDFMKAWLPNGLLPTNLDEFLAITDDEAMAGMRAAARNPSAAGHEPARRIIERRQFKVVDTPRAQDLQKCPDAGKRLAAALTGAFPEHAFRADDYSKASGIEAFTVLADDGRSLPSLDVSSLVGRVPETGFDYVFGPPEIRSEATEWLQTNRKAVLTAAAATS